MSNSCVDFTNVANARHAVRKKFGLPKKTAKKMSQQNVCNVFRDCSKNPKSLPPLRFAQADGKFFLIDKRSPLRAKDYVKLFGRPTENDLKKMYEKLGIKSNSNANKSTKDMKNEILSRLDKLDICEPVQIPASCKTEARNSSENLGNGAALMNTNNVNINSLINNRNNANANRNNANSNRNKANNVNINSLIGNRNNANANRNNKKPGLFSKFFGGNNNNKNNKNISSLPGLPTPKMNMPTVNNRPNASMPGVSLGAAPTVNGSTPSIKLPGNKAGVNNSNLKRRLAIFKNEVSDLKRNKI
jgi:hypothetical protein